MPFALGLSSEQSNTHQITGMFVPLGNPCLSAREVRRLHAQMLIPQSLTQVGNAFKSCSFLLKLPLFFCGDLISCFHSWRRFSVWLEAHTNQQPKSKLMISEVSTDAETGGSRQMRWLRVCNDGEKSIHHIAYFVPLFYL